MRVKEKYYTQLKRPHFTHFYNKCTPTHRCSLEKALLRPSTCCTVTVFNAGTLELLSQVGRKGQGVALKLLQQHKHPINSCRLKATQTDWLHAWWLITLCSCTLIWACTHTQRTLCSQAHWEDDTCTHAVRTQAHKDRLTERTKENVSSHIIFPGLAQTGSLSRLKDLVQSVTTGWS